MHYGIKVDMVEESRKTVSLGGSAAPHLHQEQQEQQRKAKAAIKSISSNESSKSHVEQPQEQPRRAVAGAAAT